jgi:hypothetical protein
MEVVPRDSLDVSETVCIQYAAIYSIFEPSVEFNYYYATYAGYSNPESRAATLADFLQHKGRP